MILNCNQFYTLLFPLVFCSSLSKIIYSTVIYLGVTIEKRLTQLFQRWKDRKKKKITPNLAGTKCRQMRRYSRQNTRVQLDPSYSIDLIHLSTSARTNLQCLQKVQNKALHAHHHSSHDVNHNTVHGASHRDPAARAKLTNQHCSGTEVLMTPTSYNKEQATWLHKN